MIEIKVAGGTIRFPVTEPIQIVFATSQGTFNITAPMKLAFAAAAEAVDK